MTALDHSSRQQQEVIERLEVLILMAADLPVSSIHRQIVSAIDLIVHISRMPEDGVVTQISKSLYRPDTNRL